MKKIKNKIALALAKATLMSKKVCINTLNVPKQQQAPLCSTIAYLIAKEKKISPQMVAQEILNKIKLPDEIITKAENGYINFYFKDEFLLKSLKSKLEFKKKTKNVMIEYPSVNPNKPWHIGHLRNALIGDSIANLLEVYGYRVIRLDYIDDLGLQVAQSIWGIKNLPAIEQDFKYKNKFDHIVGRQYVIVAKKFEEEQVQLQVRRILKEMEEGIEPTASFSKEFVNRVLKEQYKTAYRFGVYHNLIIFESDIKKTIFDDGLEKIKKSNILKYQKDGKNANCWVVDLEQEKEFKDIESDQKVIIRSDGTATYIAKDIAFHLWKFGLIEDKFLYKEFETQPNGQIAYTSDTSGKKLLVQPADVVINVIGIEQSYLQKIIKLILKKMGYKKQAKNFIHLAYEHVVLPDKKFSGRQGTWIGQEEKTGYSADELLDELIEKVKENIAAKGYGKDEIEKIANRTAINAIKFWFLKTTHTQKIVFDFDRALSLNGDSGPYVQYAYVRAKKILQKIEQTNELIDMQLKNKEYEFNEYEKDLIIQMLYFEEVVAQAAKNYEIQKICNYALLLAEKFNRFYDNCPILNSDNKKTMLIRLEILKKFVNINNKIFNILGFFEIDRM
jgi:arginyl-tRNA synthetase